MMSQFQWKTLKYWKGRGWGKCYVKNPIMCHHLWKSPRKYLS